MGVETLYFNTNITTGIKVAQARGVILLAGYRQNVPIIPVTPLQVKQQMAGYGRATKKQVIEMVMRMMNITRKIDPDDAADALAIGLTAIYHVEHRSLFERKNDRIYKRNCFRFPKDACFLETGGIGYRIFISERTRSLLHIGEEARLLTYMAVREDAILLYGFPEQDEYDLFLILISVSR